MKIQPYLLILRYACLFAPLCIPPTPVISCSRRSENFTAACEKWRLGDALSIGFAIAVTLTVFCAFRAVFVQRPPYPDPGRLVSIEKFDAYDRLINCQTNDVNFLREHALSFSELGSFGYSKLQTISQNNRLKWVQVQHVSANVFLIAKVKPLLGRVPTSSDPLESALISAQMWQKLFSGQPIVARVLVLGEEESYRIAGVLPRGFDLPDLDVDVWIPDRTEIPNRASSIVGLIGKLNSKVTIETANRELQRLTPLLTSHPHASNERIRFEVRPFAGRDWSHYISLFVLLILGAGGLLIFACLNVASSMMARANTRKFEFALRNALGGVRSRLFLLIMIESLVLSTSGGLIGIVLGYAGVRAIRQLIPEHLGLARLQLTQFDLAAWVLASGVSVIIGLLLGIVPAMFLSKIGSAKVSGPHAPRHPILGSV